MVYGPHARRLERGHYKGSASPLGSASTFFNSNIYSPEHEYGSKKLAATSSYLRYQAVFISSRIVVKLDENSKMRQMIAAALCYGVVHESHVTALV